MGLLVRTLLIWLLVLAVPAQGAVAATMAFCSPDHHGAASPLAQARSSLPQHSHHGEAMSAHGPHPGASVEIAVADETSTIASAGQVATQKCSASASCCFAGAILTAVQGVPATEPAPTVFTTVVPTVDPFAADGPDRPPRSVLA